MADEVPSIESLLGPPPAESVPSIEDLLGPAPTADESRMTFSQRTMKRLQDSADEGSIGRIMGAFGQGAGDGFGSGPLFDLNIEVGGEATRSLAGVSNSFRIFNDTILKPLAAGLDFSGRAAQAGFFGTLRAGGQVAEELDLDSAGHATRGLMDVAMMASLAAGAGPLPALRLPAMRPRVLERAEAAGVLREKPAIPQVPAETSKPMSVDPVFQKAAEEVGVAPGSAVKDTAGNINLDRINSPEDVKDVLRATAESRVIAFGESSPFIDARRGVQTNEMTAELASQLGMTQEQLLTRRKGQAFNAEEAVAARNLMTQSATEVFEISKKVAGGDDAALVKFEEAITRHIAIQEQVAGMTAEAGRALQSFRMLAGTEGGQAAALKAVIEKAGGRDKIEAMAQSISRMNDPDAISGLIAKSRKAKTVDMVREIWINFILSAFRTHEANILGNSIATMMRLPESTLTATFGLLHKGEKASFREVGAEAFGLVQGAREGLFASWKALKSGEPSDAVSKLETAKHKAIPGIAGEIIRLPGRMLITEDEFFKAVNYRAEINKQSIRTARREGLTGDAFTKRVGELRANPTDKMTEAARASQLYYSFQSELGEFGKKLTALRDASGPTGWLTLPFVRTPINIIKFAAERSPFGLLMKDVRDNLMGRNGKLARDQAAARMAIGTAVGYATYSLAAEGFISGSGPQDPAERATMRLSGWQPYSVKIGDKWYSYNRLDPLGLMVGVSADLYEAREMMGKEDSEKIGAALVASASQALLNKTWLSGPASLVAAVQDPERYGDAWIQRMAGSMVPAAVAQFAPEIDPVLRDARSMLDAMRARIPGATAKPVVGQTTASLPQNLGEVPLDMLAPGGLFPKRDVFGEEIRREGTVGGLATPISESTIRRDPTVGELMRLGIFPARLDRSIRGVDLTPEQYDEFQMVAGRFMKITLDQAVTDPVWQEFTTFEQQQRISGIITGTREAGRAYMLMKYPQILEDAIALKTAPMLAE